MPRGNAYVTGTTDSPDFPAIDPIQATLTDDGDAFATELTPAGSGQVFSTYLGDSGGAGGSGIAVDSPGNPYVTGRRPRLSDRECIPVYLCGIWRRLCGQDCFHHRVLILLH